MSTKIYDAYKFDKKYSFDELMTIFERWRKDIRNIAEKEFANMCLRKFAFYYDLVTIKGSDFIKEQREKLEPIEKNRTIIRLYELLENIDSDNIPIAVIMMHIVDIINESIHNKDKGYNYIAQMFKSDIYVYTVSRKILFMYFGGVDYQNYIMNQPEVEDYHYQNQTDRPEDISEDSWKRRAFNWDKAIGPDYIPSNHGIAVHFINNEDIEFSILNKYIKVKNISNESFPTLDERVEMMIDYFNDYLNPPENIDSYSVFLKYSNTDEYKNWKKQKKEYIKEHIVPDLYEIYIKNKRI